MPHASEKPLIVNILTRLAGDWILIARRFERRTPKREKRVAEAERAAAIAERLSRLDEERRKCFREKFDAAEDAASREDDAYHLHPFPDVADRIATLIGSTRLEIIQAARCKFHGEAQLVERLHRLDNSGRLQPLYEAILARDPKLAAKIGLGAPTKVELSALGSEERSASEILKTVEKSNRITNKELNVLLREYLKANPKPAVRDAMKAIGCKSMKTFYKLPAWVAVNEEFKKGREPKPKTVSLSESMKAVVPDRGDGELAKLTREHRRDYRSEKVGIRERA